MYNISCVKLIVLVIIMYAHNTYALPFGTFDARSLAMGGTGVASATSENAGYFNPALMAQYKLPKEKGKNSRFIFPIISLLFSEKIDEVKDVEKENYNQKLSDAVNNFNAAPQDLFNVSSDLQSELDNISSNPVFAEGNVALVVGIAGEFEGGAIIINRRIAAEGALNYTANDRDLLNAYIEESTYVANGGIGTLHPELYDNGQLRNITGDLTSEVISIAVVIVELSMSVSKRLRLFGTSIMLGVTPKLMQVTTYDATTDAQADYSFVFEKNENDFSLNADIGVAVNYSKKWTAGLVVKNIKKRDYRTELDNVISFKPQVRAGIAYKDKSRGRYGLDIDLLKNDPLNYGDSTQVLGMGGEWKWRWSQIRAGLNKNLTGTGDNRAVLYTIGLHADLSNKFIDFTYAGNGKQTGVAFQIGSKF